jgi:glycosyltransferase involved in cell wall biosynthesis
MKGKSYLILLTQKFPFESGEEFLATELTFLEKAFDNVIIIPTAVRDFSHRRPVGANTHVRIVKNPETIKEIAVAFFCRFFQVLRLLASELRKSDGNIKLLKYYLYHIPYALLIKSIITKELNGNGEFVLYSYWMDTNAYSVALLRKERPEIKLVVRSHGGDLYNERQASGVVPFRQTVYEASESLVFISEHGHQYAATHYPEFSLKSQVFRLGVEDLGVNPTFNFPAYFQVVSCSSLISLKRVPLIAAVLNNSSVPICWTHFGGESSAITTLKNNLPKLRDDFTINWKGKVSNKEISEYYASEFVDVFINLSSTEGIPVSMMEAISFGIPLFANAVGGTPEIATEATGKLLPEGLSVENLASQLDRFLLSGVSRDLKYRRGVKQFWSQNYSAEFNYRCFIDHLKKSTF